MQSTPAAPSVVLNSAGDKRQVPLRDYLNSRIAPFLKKAMTQSLEAEAEFPLQWLGECLINQSILYEGNPDSTNIKERFRYDFSAPPPVTQEPPVQPEVNGIDNPETASEITAITTETSTLDSTANVDRPVPNGQGVMDTATEEKEESAEARTQDTVMGGTT